MFGEVLRINYMVLKSHYSYLVSYQRFNAQDLFEVAPMALIELDVVPLGQNPKVTIRNPQNRLEFEGSRLSTCDLEWVSIF